MASRKPSRALLEIVAVREVQKLAEEMALTRAAAVLARSTEEEHGARRQLEQDVEAWSISIAGANLDLGLAGLWSSTIRADEGMVRQAAARAREARAERNRVSVNWSSAVARCEAAGDLAEAAVRRERRQREEALLSEAADRTAIRMRRP